MRKSSKFSPRSLSARCAWLVRQGSSIRRSGRRSSRLPARSPAPRRRCDGWVPSRADQGCVKVRTAEQDRVKALSAEVRRAAPRQRDSETGECFFRPGGARPAASSRERLHRATSPPWGRADLQGLAGCPRRGYWRESPGQASRRFVRPAPARRRCCSPR